MNIIYSLRHHHCFSFDSWLNFILTTLLQFRWWWKVKFMTQNPVMLLRTKASQPGKPNAVVQGGHLSHLLPIWEFQLPLKTTDHAHTNLPCLHHHHPSLSWPCHIRPTTVPCIQEFLNILTEKKHNICLQKSNFFLFFLMQLQFIFCRINTYTSYLQHFCFTYKYTSIVLILYT